MKKLYKDIWADTFVNATLIVENEIYHIKIGFRGNQLRRRTKKSFHIVFVNPYFMNGQHEIHLNAEYNDPSLMRNKLSFDFFNSIDVLAPNSNHVLLYVNGECKGIYLVLESFDQYYLHNRGLPEGSIYYATNDDANFSLITPEGYVKKSLIDGYTTKYLLQNEDYLKKLLVIINTYNHDQFNKEIVQLLDIEKYFKWLAGVVCTQNFDGFIHNYALYHNSATGCFEITPWDYDGTWGRNLHGEPMTHDYVPITGYNTLTARLLETPHFKEIYRRILHFVLNEKFTSSILQPQIEHIHSNILFHIEKDPYIDQKIDTFLNEKDYILEFIEKRRNYLIKQLTTF